MELTGQLVEIFQAKAFAVVRDNAQPFFLNQLSQFADLTDDELLDALCFFTDFVDNTDAKLDIQLVNDLASKFLQICTTPAFEDSEDLQQTIAFGFGVFAYALPKGQFGLLAPAAVVCNQIL